MRQDPEPARSQVRRLISVVATGLLAIALTVSLGPSASAGAGGDAAAEAEALRQIELLDSTAAPLKPIKCTKAGHRAGWRGMDLVLATAISLAESGCDPTATGTNPPTEGCPDGSRDRGAWQINDCYHPGVDDECAYDLQCNAHAAYQIYLDRSSTFQPWTTYNTRAFRFFLSEARNAVRRLTGDNIVIGVVLTEGGSLNVRNKPRTSGDVVGQLADRAVVRIRCQTRGESIYSPIFGYETRIWDSDGPGRFFSDGYVHTDSRKRIAPRC